LIKPGKKKPKKLKEISIMAQSIFEIIETGKIEVNHNGEDCIFNLPEWLKKAAGKLENKEALLKWAIENTDILGALHEFIGAAFIGLRATIRPAAKKNKEGNLVPVSLIEDAEKAQERANNFVIKPKIRPGTGGKTPEQRQAEALKLLNGLTPEQIAEVLRKASRN
jgi:hypothetical protein